MDVKRIGLLASALLLPVASQAGETWLCLPSAAAGVEETTGGGFNAGPTDASARKLLLINDGTKWVVRDHAMNYPIYDKCISNHFCEHSTGYTGIFMFDDKTNIFTATWISANVETKKQSAFVAKGKCSKIQ